MNRLLVIAITALLALPSYAQQSTASEATAPINIIDDLMGVALYREYGRLVGFRIRPKHNRKLFYMLGLKDNDIVTTVDNVGLVDTSQTMQLYRSFVQSSQARLEILRDGATTIVDINLDAIQ